MARITVEDCLSKENNRFSLVLLAAKRTKQLLRGSSAKIDNKTNKAVVTALREIAAGEVRFMTEAEADDARKLAEQKRAERLAQQAAAMPAPIDIPLPTLDQILPAPNGGKNGPGLDDEEE